MEPEASDWQAVVGRLEKLERQNRRLKQVGAVVLILAAAVLLMGQALPYQTVEANEFVLKDSRSGKVRGRFHMYGNDPQLWLMNENGQNRAVFGMGAGGSELTLFHPNGIIGASLNMACFISPGQCHPTLDLRDQDENYEVVLRTHVGGSTIRLGEVYQLKSKLEQTLNAVQATPGANISLNADGISLELQDREGFMTTIGTANLVTFRSGETHKTSAASVILFDKDKNLLWKAP